MTNAASVLSSTAPETGQLVQLRRHQWIVSDIDASSVSPELPKRNLVKLASIDEDALGEEIEVLKGLSALNRQRYDEEPAAAPNATPRAPESRAKVAPAGQGVLALADAPTTTSKAKAATRRTSK